MNSPLLEKSMDFATQIVLFYEEFSKSKKDTTIAKQLLRSATSIGANINEAIYGNSKADFIFKLATFVSRRNQAYADRFSQYRKIFARKQIISPNLWTFRNLSV